MKLVSIMALVIVTVADMVPHAGPYLALVASAMAAWAFTHSPKMAVGTILYGIIMTVVYSPGFILKDLARGGGTRPDNLPPGVAELADSVGALATGTMPLSIKGGMGEVTQLSMEVTVVLVVLHIIALVIGFRRKAAATRAEQAEQAEDGEYVYD